MTFLLVLFIIFLIFGWVLPRLMPYLLKWIIKRRVNEFGRRMQAQADAAFGGAHDQAPEPEGPKPRKKKIDPNVGEYVRFEEVTVTTAENVTDDGETQRVDRSVKIEDQIIDVEWEDLPPSK